MLALIVCILILLSMLDRASRIGRLELVMLKTENELLALRDALDQAAISGTINVALFKILSARLRNTAETLGCRHLLGLFGSLLYTDLDEVAATSARFSHVLTEPENSRALAIEMGLRKSILHFMMGRHRIIFPRLDSLANSTKEQLQKFEKRVRSEQLKAALYSERPQQDNLKHLAHHC